MLTRLYYKIKWELVDKASSAGCYRQYGYDVINDKELKSIVDEALNQRKPLCIGKIGATECFAVIAYLLFENKGKIKAYNQLCDTAGFFPKDYDSKRMSEYVKIQTDAISSLDVMIEFPKCYEEYVFSKYCKKDMKTVSFSDFGPYGENSWVSLLKGRKVLVVHPFVPLIDEQYKNRTEIYPDGFLPEFELITVKAVQSIGGECNNKYDTWIDALNNMKNAISTIDFEIALIGCGAYGLPLAAEIKKMGRTAIHMGADIQLLFGIKGKRWDGTALAQKLYNDFWIYPGDKYKPKGYNNVENGCYW